MNKDICRAKNPATCPHHGEKTVSQDLESSQELRKLLDNPSEENIQSYVDRWFKKNNAAEAEIERLKAENFKLQKEKAELQADLIIMRETQPEIFKKLLDMSAEFSDIVNGLAKKPTSPLVNKAIKQLKTRVAGIQNTTGATGELKVREKLGLHPRPTGKNWDNLMKAFANKTGVDTTGFAKTGFDGLLLLNKVKVDFSKVEDIEKNFNNLVLVEIKSTTRTNLKENFGNLFFL